MVNKPSQEKPLPDEYVVGRGTPEWFYIEFLRNEYHQRYRIALENGSVALGLPVVIHGDFDTFLFHDSIVARKGWYRIPYKELVSVELELLSWKWNRELEVLQFEKVF